MLILFNAFTLGFGPTPTKPVDQRPSVADLPACDSKPAHQFNYLRTLLTPREFTDAGKFTAVRPRTDWITVHDFTFPESPPGQMHTAVYTEMGAVGGPVGNMEMFLANGAPGGFTDLRTVHCTCALCLIEHIKAAVPHRGVRYSDLDTIFAETVLPGKGKPPETS